MSTFISELKDLVLYNKDFYAPIQENDKLRGSCILLLTPDIKSSKSLMTYPKMINRRYFESYYIEKDITYFINQENALIKSYDTLIHESVNTVLESKLSSEERKKLKDKDFGLPDTRQYPIHDRGHVYSAIRYFGSCPEEKRLQLAKNIKKKADKFNIKIADNSLLHTYLESFYLEDVEVSDKALAYRLDEWKKGESNILFISGYAGSGKSSLAREIANEYMVQHVELDHYCKELFKDSKDLSHETKTKILAANLKNEFGNKRCIIEGVQVLSLISDDTSCSIVRENSLIVLETSFAKSTFRAIKRDIELFDKYVDKYNLATTRNKMEFLFKKVFINYPKLNFKLAFETSFMNMNAIRYKLFSVQEATLLSEVYDIFNSLNEEEKKFIGNDYLECTETHTDEVEVLYRKVYKEDSTSIGFLDLYRRKNISDLIDETFVEIVIGVKEGYRNKGLARKMMNEMFNTIKDNTDIKHVVYTAHVENTKSNNLAKSMGMEYKHQYMSETGMKNLYHMNMDDYNKTEVVSEYVLTESVDDFKATYTNKTHELTESYLRINTEDSNCIIYFNELLDEQVLNESDSANNPKLKRLLYNERIRNNKEAILIYDEIKADVPIIKRTHIDYRMYKQRNLFIDWSYYTETFFKNNIYKLDKGIDLYFDFVTRFLDDKRLELNGYHKKTVFVPILDWVPKEEDVDAWDHTKTLNPISCIYRLMKTNPERLKEWGQYDFLFLGETGYFKVNFNTFDKTQIPRFLTLVRNIINKTPIIYDNKETTKAIVANIVDKLETNTNVKIHNLTGGTATLTPEELEAKINDIGVDKDSDSEKKAAVVTAIKKAAEESENTEEALDKLDGKTSDYVKNILINLDNESQNSINMNKSRASRMIQINDEFLNKKLGDKPVKDIITYGTKVRPIEKMKIPVDNINEGWEEVSFPNFQKLYDLDEDIVKILMSFSKKSVPIGIIDIKKEDTSTTEDYVYTYTVKCEDGFGQRFTLKFDIPKFKNNRFMRLRGNDKTINGQLVLLPIIKTDTDVCQIVSNYNKIFIRRYGSAAGKSYVIADRILKTLEKNDFKDIKVVKGDNTLICNKYELPMDYIDIASVIDSIETKNGKIYFNQDEIRAEIEKRKFKIDNNLGIPVAIMKNRGDDKFHIMYTGNFENFSYGLYSSLCTSDGFREAFNSTSVSSKYTYSKASILNTEIPIVVIMGYNVGLQTVLNKANVRFEVTDKRETYDKSLYDIIKFKDGYIKYDLNYNSSLLLNGLKECNTQDYSLSEMNSKGMWLDFLDIFTNRIKADGLDNFYDLMIDPITEEVCQDFKLPTEYIDLLAYSNLLLCDNKYNKHVDISGNRLRTNEIVAGYTYKVLADAYGDYKNQLKRGKKGATMSIKQSAVLDALLLDPTSSDFSFLNPLNELESANAVSFKGLSGMNSDRSYSLDKRTFDDSMINVVGMSTGFAGNVGITRQATIDCNVEGKRGYIKMSKSDNMNTTKSLTITEALTPMGCTHDDTFRSAMTFIQASKHTMRVAKSSPNLVTNGADEALPYLTSDAFAFKAKQDGKVIEKTENHMILKYKDGTIDYIDIRNNIKKNSDGGFYISVQLDSKYKKGSSFKKNDILAYDPLSYSKAIGDHTNERLSFNTGTLCKIAIMNTDEGFEDSAIISEWLAEAMTSDIIIKKEKYFPKDTNIYQMVKKGQPIQEGEPLVIFQNAFEDEDANALLKNLTADNESISELGRIYIKSKVTGVVEDVYMYRTVDTDQLSDSLKKEVSKYEKNIRDMKNILKKYNIDGAHDLEPDYKLPPTGKLKNVYEGVLVEFYLRYRDKMSIGDKLVYYSALKGVIKDIFPKDKEPYTDFRPNEKIHSLLTISSINARMVSSVKLVGGINKVVLELDRKVKDIMGVKYKNLDEM